MEGEEDVVGGRGPAIVPAHVATEVEDHRRVALLLPRTGQGRLEREIRGVADQGREQDVAEHLVRPRVH